MAAPEPPARKPPRVAYILVQFLAIVVTAGLTLLIPKFQTIYDQLEMKYVPGPTELALGWGSLMANPWGVCVLLALGIGLAALAWKGVLDRFLSRLIWLNVLWIPAIIAFMALSVFMPIMKIQQALNAP